MPPFPHNNPTSGPCKNDAVSGQPFKFSLVRPKLRWQCFSSYDFHSYTQCLNFCFLLDLGNRGIWMKNSQRNSEKHQLCDLLHRTTTSSPSITFAYSISSQYTTVIPLLICIYFLLCQSLYRAVHGLSTLYQH